MNFNFFKERIPPEGTVFVPDEGLSRLKRIYTTHWWKLLMLNMIVLLCVVPVVTLPIAVVAANRVMIRLIRDGNCFWWDEFKREFRQSFADALILGLAAVPATLIAMTLITFSSAFAKSPVTTVLGIVMLTTLIWAWIVLCYAYVMRAFMDLSAVICLRNAIILSLTEWKYNWRFVLLLMLMIAGVFFLPHSLLLWLLGLFSLILFLACGFALPVFERKIVSGGEK